MSASSSTEPHADVSAAPDSTVPVVTPGRFDAAPEVDPDSNPDDRPLRLTAGWIAVGVAAVGLGLVMGFIMSSVWIVR